MEVLKISSRDCGSNSGLVKTGSKSERVFIAVREATSPPAYPPIPSATAIRFSETNPESSFPSRCNPNSDRQAKDAK